MTQNSRYGGDPIYEDRKIPCSDCGTWFEFSISEQKYFGARGWRKPKRCPACRKINRTARADDPRRPNEA